jgi:glucose/arabinose dehydrogenase
VALALVAIGTVLGVLAARDSSDEAPPASPTPTRTRTATATASPSPTVTPTITPTATLTPAPRAQATATPAPPPSSGNNPPSGPRANGYRLVGAVQTATFDRMVGFAMFPGSNDAAVVITQRGAIWRVSVSGAFNPTPFGDFSSRLISNPGNEEGLLGFAFSPRFQSDGRVFVYYSAGNPRRSVLSRFSANAGAMDMGSERVILEIAEPYPNHNGGQLAFGPDGMLYVAVGDGGSAGDPHGNGQNLGTLLGSILRIDVSGDGYTVPGDNPFVGRQGARGEIWAYGLRNPWRFGFDRQTGALWAGDVGQNRWEEVDRVTRGGNYGWNIMEGFSCFSTANCNQSGLIAPRAVYGHGDGCSVTGGFVYRGPSMPELNGYYVYGDFCTGNIWGVNTSGGSPPVLLAASGAPISSFAELPNGELLAITFSNRIMRLQRA